MIAARRRLSYLMPCALAVAACNNASRLDGAMSGSNDRWPSHGGGSRGSDDDGDAGALGVDLRGMLTRVTDSMKKPGPYEEPDQSPGFDASKPHWAVIELDGAVVEQRAFSFTGDHHRELRAAIKRFHELAGTTELLGVVLRIGHLEISLPDAIELRVAMHALRDAGKHVVCHTESASNASYLVLAACERIGLAPLGEITITGPAAMPVHIKPLLDKLGVTADFVHVGAYKGAAEPLTRDAPSREMEETLGAILDRRYQTMIDTIAQERRLEPTAVKRAIDTALWTPEQARAAQLIDDIDAFEPFRDQATQNAWTNVELDSDHADQLQGMLKIARFLGAMPPERPTARHVALVYALGNIVDGDGGGVLGASQRIASHTLVAALRALAADDHVTAVVLRIDSGGGSAQASELIWRAVADLRANKPVIVSMSDVAASGGYYIASGATKIFALEDTLTGSIGVVGGKLAPGGALARLGVNTFPMGRGKHATMMSSLAPWTDDERAAIQSAMDAVYDVFVRRVAEGRHKKPSEVLPIAQGRVWTGAKAKELGLVDDIGGLEAALAEARKLGKVDAATELEIYPPSPTLRDVLTHFGEVDAPLGLRSETAALLTEAAAIDPALADATGRLLGLVASFRDARIQTVAIVPLVR